MIFWVLYTDGSITGVDWSSPQENVSVMLSSNQPSNDRNMSGIAVWASFNTCNSSYQVVCSGPLGRV